MSSLTSRTRDSAGVYMHCHWQGRVKSNTLEFDFKYIFLLTVCGSFNIFKKLFSESCLDVTEYSGFFTVFLN